MAILEMQGMKPERWGGGGGGGVSDLSVALCGFFSDISLALC
jgi:hypothetical protein